MFELTTGVVFLLSSLYGAGQTNADLAAAAIQAKTAYAATSSITIQRMNENEVEAYVRKEYADTPILIEIARCESNFHQFNEDGVVVRGRVNKDDVGVMQINEHYHADTAIAKDMNLYTTEGNVAFGRYLYEKYGTSPWNSSSKCWSSAIAKK